MQSAAQQVLDTRAIEIAAEARATSNTAREECGRDYRDLRLDVTGLRTSISAEFKELREQSHKGRGAIYKLLWGVMLGVIMILLAIIGFLFVAAYPPDHGSNVRRTVAMAVESMRPRTVNP